MPIRIQTRRPIRPSEQGYLMVAVIFMLALLVIAMAVAAPRVRDDIQRDREVETMHRGKQYIRAIRLYYRKFHAYPPNVDALVKTNDIRFLRKKYIDPMTGKDDWKPILFGQNKQPTMFGFFGQPLGGSTIAGTGPAGGNGLQGAQGGAFNQPGQPGQPGGSSIFGSDNTQPGSQTGINTGTGTPGDNPGGTGANGQNTGFGGGQTFGGAGIIGFSPASPKQSILVYKKMKHYNEWEFVYDPRLEQMMAGGAFGGGLNGQPAGTTPIGGAPGYNNPNQPGFGGTQNQTGIFNNNTPTQPVTPTPQQ
jgi:type II secretory pathway pseudopilin PulG